MTNRRENLAQGREHLTASGTFQSDRYPGCPAGKVPLSVKDPLAQDLLWEYARRHEEARKHGDSEFPRDLREALMNAGFKPAEGLVVQSADEVEARALDTVLEAVEAMPLTRRCQLMIEATGSTVREMSFDKELIAFLRALRAEHSASGARGGGERGGES